MKHYLFAFLLVFALPTGAKNCRVYLTFGEGRALTENPTDNFIAFVVAMHKEKVVDDTYLEKLSHGELFNPLDKKVITKSDDHVFKEIFQTLINNKPDKQKIANWAKQTLEKTQQTKKEKDQSKAETRKAAIKMQFHRIEPGELDTRHAKGIILDTPFDMMSTAVTQKMWLDLMGDKPKGDIETPSGDDYPAVHISWWSAITFANKLSEKNNLPPVYDMSAYKDWRGEAAKGTLVPFNAVEATKLLKINAPDGNIYKAKGYRLPTLYEHIFAASDRGRSNTKTFTNIDEKNMHQYAMITSENIDYYEVATKLPFIIDAQTFYDLYGSATEWLHDVKNTNWHLAASIPAIVSYNESIDQAEIMTTSNNFTLPVEDMSASSYSGWRPGARITSLSFRLVRTLFD